MTPTRGFLRRPDFSVNSKYPNVCEQWQFDARWTMASSPAVAVGRVFAGDGAGKMRALSLKNRRAGMGIHRRRPDLFHAGGGRKPRRLRLDRWQHLRSQGVQRQKAVAVCHRKIRPWPRPASQIIWFTSARATANFARSVLRMESWSGNFLASAVLSKRARWSAMAKSFSAQGTDYLYALDAATGHVALEVEGQKPRRFGRDVFAGRLLARRGRAEVVRCRAGSAL